jgi:hypothetical protein
MKKCPSCGRTYSDPALNFCLQDGTVLEQDTVSTFGNEETVVFGQTPPTNPGGSPYGGPSTNPGGQSNPGGSSYGSLPNTPPPTWQANPYAVAQAQPRRKKSRAWLWILLSFLFICFVGVVGFAGFLMYIGMKIDQEEKNNKNRVVATNTNKSNKSNGNSNSKTTSSNDDVKKDDFSDWDDGTFDYGKIEHKDDRLVLTSSKSDYYTIVATAKDFLTNDATTKVTVKNLNKGNSKLGFGLVVNASPIKPLFKDYAFLIRTGDKPGYRIVSHLVSQEKDIVKWTSNSAIQTGDNDNLLEVRDEGSKLSFYVNGTLITSINDENGSDSSIGGIYAGDAIPIAFADLEISKSH